MNSKKPHYLTFHKPLSCFSSLYKSFTQNSNINLILHGQGVFLFNTKSQTPFSLTFYNESKNDGLKVDFLTNSVLITRISNSDQYASQNVSGGITNKSGAYYWISFDSQNQLLQAGIGEPRIETAIYKYQFDKSDKLYEANKIFLESIKSICIPNHIIPMKLLKDPIQSHIPLIVKNTNELTMEDIANNTFLPHASLSQDAQMLYNCVSGNNFILNTSDFPDFAKAVEYSIATDGCWCNTRLKEKATEFGKDPNPLETYLRITLGENNGESPGIPYVMEIWPIGHYSPIHNHGGANAIIRVLHGSIQVNLYPYLCTDVENIQPFAAKEFYQNDITWLSPTYNQIHQLKNLENNKDTCITIQCYLYDHSDKLHYDYFDYLGEENSKHQYEPDSDMDFIQFKNKMKEEWENRNKNNENEN